MWGSEMKAKNQLKERDVQRDLLVSGGIEESEEVE